MKPLLIILLFINSSLGAQDSSYTIKKSKCWFDVKENFHNDRLYVYWGYNREFFTNSDIHFHGTGYDFTVYNVAARDRPTKLSIEYLNPATISIPQFNVRVGFYLKHDIHVSLGYDHMKYVMKQDQTVKMSGVIDPSVSTTYAGSYVNSNRVLSADFLRFEHTNGLNLVTVDVEYLLSVYHTRKDWVHVGWNFGVGGLLVVPKTEVHVIGIGMDNRFHIAGYCLPVKMGPRIDIWKYFFVAFEVKAGYMHLPDILIRDNQTDLANQHFSFIEYYGVAGLSYKFEKRKKAKQ